jgi:Kdo2-lipid IVA lauroyltransferase/acyltransferase
VKQFILFALCSTAASKEMKKKPSKINNFKAALSKAAIITVGQLPFSWSRKLAKVFRFVAIKFQLKNTRITRINIKKCFPKLSSDEQNTLVNESILLDWKNAIDTCIIWQKGLPNLNLNIEIKGMDIFERYITSPNGLILAPLHSGNWEVTAYASASICKTVGLYKSLKLQALDEFILKRRQKSGSHYLAAEHASIREILRNIIPNQVVFIFPDQEPGKNGGEFAPFFGHDAYTPTLIPKIVKKKKSAFLYITCKSTTDGFVLEYIDSKLNQFDGPIDQSMQILNQEIESIIADDPAEYYWSYRRFKTQPVGHPKFYR